MHSMTNGEVNDPSVEMNPKPMEICIIPGWDRTLKALEDNPLAASSAQEAGFSLADLYVLVTTPFAPDLEVHKEYDKQGRQTEEKVIDTIVAADGKELDRTWTKLFPAAAAESPLIQMTQFQKGAEVILVTDGGAELTYAEKVTKEGIPRSSLKSIKVQKGDLIISITTPNNWTDIQGGFKIIYFVINPEGPRPHRYSEIPKTKVPVI